jgi:predicted enzyme related to lactoylglutathione lyase
MRKKSLGKKTVKKGERTMSRVIHFEIPAVDPVRASTFYQKVFGWKFDKWAGPMEYWMVTTGADGIPGINGGMLRKPGPVSVTTNTIGVGSVDVAIEAAKSAGGKLVMPKSPIPGVGYFAYCEDTEGNLFGVMQADTNAK